jgi:hypothetical protein
VATTYLLTLVAAMAFVPTVVLLYLALDPYTAPKVPVSLFEERKVFLTFAVGIPGSIPLALVFLLYAGAVEAPNPFIALVWALVFALVASLGRRILLGTKTFGGAGGNDPAAPVFAFAFGAVSGATIFLALALNQVQINSVPSGETLGLLAGFSVDLGLLEAWAGVRTGERLREGFSWLPPWDVFVVELVCLGLLGVPFLGIEGLKELGLVAAFVLLVLFLRSDLPRIFGRLRKRSARDRGRRFGRGVATDGSTSLVGGNPPEASPTDPAVPSVERDPPGQGSA